MTWFTDLGTPYHQQDTDYYCGAAVAQMVLDSIGSGLLDQNTLYNSNHAHSSGGWYTSPDGLNFTLNAYMPPPRCDSFFIVERADTEPWIGKHRAHLAILRRRHRHAGLWLRALDRGALRFSAVELAAGLKGVLAQINVVKS